MQCTRCSGLVLERYGAFSCINCGHDPFLKLITVKCSNPDCFAMPELHDYCARCWHSRVRDPRTEAEKSKAYRERMRLKQQKRRAKLKEVTSDVHVIGTYAVGEESRIDYQNGTSLPAEAVSGMARSDGQRNQATM